MNSLELYVCEKELDGYFKKWEDFNIHSCLRLTRVTKTRKRRSHNYMKQMYSSMLRMIGRI